MLTELATAYRPGKAVSNLLQHYKARNSNIEFLLNSILFIAAVYCYYCKRCSTSIRLVTGVEDLLEQYTYCRISCMFGMATNKFNYSIYLPSDKGS